MRHSLSASAASDPCSNHPICSCSEATTITISTSKYAASLNIVTATQWVLSKC